MQYIRLRDYGRISCSYRTMVIYYLLIVIGKAHGAEGIAQSGYWLIVIQYGIDAGNFLKSPIRRVDRLTYIEGL